jgi:nucleoside-diphosphate-sugar epimerase
MSSQYVCATRERLMTGQIGRAGVVVMTTTLVLGGTAWLGGEVARAALRRGHEVTCLARGVAGSPPSGVRWVQADRDAADAYDAVRGQDWDDVVDVSWQPGQVRSALAALAPRARHWTYVSSCSVYAAHSVVDVDESAALLPALDAERADREQYGEAKVACEQLCQAAVGERLLLARSGVIGGYGDRSDRFGYWPGRFALARRDGGSVLVPDADDLPTQAIDVRDLADWLVRMGDDATTGAMNVVGERRAFGDVIAAAREVAGFDGPGSEERVVRVPSRWLLDEGVDEYMGPRSLPLWMVDPDWAGFSARNGDRAVAAGLTHRPLRDLLADSLRWEDELGLDRDRRAGLTRAEENELLDRWASRD